MLGTPTQTDYDLKFRIFDIPVRVHPLFWLGALFFGSRAFDLGLAYVAIWVAVMFSSILVHELGHAFANRAFGTWTTIVLWMFGGLAIPGGRIYDWWRRVNVSLAGPAAGFVLLGVVYGSNRIYPWARADPHLAFAYICLWFVNLYWGIINLLPVLPLDGGHVCEEICTHLSPRKGLVVALNISLVTAGVICVYSIACFLDARDPIAALRHIPNWFPRGSQFTAIFFGLMAYDSYQMLQRARWSDSHWQERDAWRR